MNLIQYDQYTIQRKLYFFFYKMLHCRGLSSHHQTCIFTVSVFFSWWDQSNHTIRHGQDQGGEKTKMENGTNALKVCWQVAMVWKRKTRLTWHFSVGFIAEPSAQLKSWAKASIFSRGPWAMSLSSSSSNILSIKLQDHQNQSGKWVEAISNRRIQLDNLYAIVWQ